MLPLYPGEDARPLAYRHDLVRPDFGNLFAETARPLDFQGGARFRTQTEMQAALVHGVKARLAQHRLRLRLTAVAGFHNSADGRAVRLHALELHLQPVSPAAHVV